MGRESVPAIQGQRSAVQNFFVFKVKPEQAAAFRLKFILAVLNSKFISHYALKNQIIRVGKGKQPQIRKSGLDTIPISDISIGEQRPFVDMVDRILAAKRRDAETDTSALEREIDELVYALYGLTPQEIKLVEGSAK